MKKVLKRTIKFLNEKDIELSATEIADVLWLYSIMEKENKILKNEKVKDEKNKNLEKSLNKNDKSPDNINRDEVANDDKDSSSSLYRKEEESSKEKNSSKGSHFSVPTRKHYNHFNQFATVLKILRKFHDSSTLYEFDEHETIEYIVNTGIFDIVEKPKKELKYTVYIVIEVSTSMSIWDELNNEFVSALSRFSFFKKVNVLYLKEGKKKYRLFKDKECHKKSSIKIFDSFEKRNLTMLLTDCVSMGWRDKRGYKFLNKITQLTPFMIVNMLPQRMWVRTALHKTWRVNFTHKTNWSNKTLVSDIDNSLDKDEQKKIDFGEHLRIPMTTLDTLPFKHWANLVSGKRNNLLNGSIFEATVFKEEKIIKNPPPTDTFKAEDLVNAFYSYSSPMAQKLMIYLSAVDLNMEIMKMVQRTSLPKSNHTHLAEVFLSGLLKRHDTDGNIFDFKEGVREILLDKLYPYKIQEIREKNAEFIRNNIGFMSDFSAIIKTPDSMGEINIPETSKPFAYSREEDIMMVAEDSIEYKSKMKSEIILYSEKDIDVNLISLVNYLNKICTYLSFKVGKEPFRLKDKKVSWSESYKNLNSAIHEETKYSIGAFFFTTKQYNDRYFFEGNTAFPNLMIVSFSGWSSLSSLPYSNAIAYFVAEILSLDLSSYQHRNESIGCLYDFLSNKSDIDNNMREAYICKDCYSRIEDNKSDVNMKVLKDIESILEVVGRASSNDLDILEDRNNSHKNNMLSVKELEKIISQGEGAKIDFKRQWYWNDNMPNNIKETNKNELVKDLIALTNGDVYSTDKTAYLIIGIDDESREVYDFDKSTILPLDKLKRQLLTLLNNYAHPEFLALDIELVDGVLIISIPPQNNLISLSKDIKLRNRIDRKGTTYYRVGEDIRIASPDVIRDFDKVFDLKKDMTLSCDEVIKYTVEVKYKESKGSGFILKLDTVPNSFFVITAKHIFINDFKSSNDNIVIDEVLISYKSEVIVPKQIIFLEADIIAFVFDNSVSIDNLNTIPLASSPNQFKESIFAGYSIRDNLICQKCSYSHKLEEKNLYQITSNREYDTRNISGVGGSGLFIKEDGHYSIVGMIVQYDEMVSAFRYIALAPYIKEIIDRVELLQNKRTEDIKEKKNDSVEEKIKKVLLDELTKWNNTFSNISFLTKNIEFAQNINNSMHFINQLIEIVKISEYDDLAPLFDNVNQLEESNKNKKSFSFKYDPKDILIYQLEEAISFLLPLSSLVLYDNSKKVINSLIKTLNKIILIIQNMSMHELENILDKNNVILNSINEFGLKPISNSDKNNTIENVSNSIENFEQTIEYIKNYKDLLLEEGIKNIIISYPFDTYSLKEFREAILKDFDWMQTYLHNLNNSNNYIKDSNSKFHEHYCSFYRFLCDEIADDLLIIKLFLHIKDIYCAKKDTKYFYNLEASWLKHLENEFSQPYMQTLKNFLQEEKAQGKTILPKESLWFNALDSTPLHEVKVVILGQDPYPTIGHAHGLSFSALPEVHPFPKSLINIYKELQDDLDIDNFHTPYLQPWAEQGVLLLNAVLTVEAGKANSHQGKGWEQFTDKIIEIVNQECNNVVFLLWGAYAQKKGSFIDITRHMIIKSPNPSPLSAFRGFLGSRPFSRTNDYLTSKGKKPIDWQLYKDQESKKKNNLKFKVLDKFEQEVFKNKYEADIINFLNSHRPDEFEYKEIYADWLPSDNNDAYIVAYDGAESVEINNINKSEPNQYQVGITMEYIVEIELNIFKYDYAGNDEEYTLIESLNDHYYTVGKEVTLTVEAELYFELYEENEFLESECVLKIKDIEILDERKENNGDIGAIESAQSANVLLKNAITYLQDNKKHVIQDIVNSLEEGEKKYIVDLLENKKSFIKSVDNHFLWMIDYMKELNNEKVNLDSLTIIESLYPVYCDFYREFAIYIEKNKIPDNIKKILKKFSNEIANKYKCN